MQQSKVRDLWKMLRGMDGLTDRQMILEDIRWEESTGFHYIIVSVRPNDGPYHGGQFHFQIDLGPRFPLEAPDVACLDIVYHPNIDPTESERNICLSLLDEWQPTNRLDDVIQGILFLLHNPNTAETFSPYFDTLQDEKDFRAVVRRAMNGEAVDGCKYTRVITDSGVTSSEKENIVRVGGKEEEKDRDYLDDDDTSKTAFVM